MAGTVVQRAAARHSGRLLISSLCMAFVVSGIREASGLVTTTCVLENGLCGPLCRKATCEALLDFYNSTNTAEVSHSWAIKEKWETALGRKCTDILRAPVHSPPEYCQWYGVVCCWDSTKCGVLYTVMGLALPVNDLTGDISSPKLLQAVAQLHGCGLNQLTLDGNNLYGSLTNDWGQFVNLTEFNIARNQITGTIHDSLRSLRKLKRLSLGGNPMHGTIPSWLGELTGLRALLLGAMTHFNPGGTVGLTGTIPESLANLTDLQALELGPNSLNGTIPEGLCHSNIRLFSMPGNDLSANLTHLLACKGATRIDLSYNRISGTLPNVPRWELYQLSGLSLNNNQINGSIPRAMLQLPTLSFISLANNRLTGTIDRNIGQMQSMSAIMMHSNMLNGTIPDSLWTLSRINQITLADNALTGTISPAIGNLKNLNGIDLAGNKLTGDIPPQMGYLGGMISADVRNNSLGCTALTRFNSSSNQSGGNTAFCDVTKLLPCFLELTDFTVPRSDSSNMACPEIRRKPYTQALADCGVSTQLGQQASKLPGLSQDAQLWYLDPSYHNYSGCVCLEGFYAAWERSGLSCLPRGSAPLPNWVVPIAVVLSIVGAMLVTVAALLVWFRLAVQIKAKWQREQELAKHRQLGVPSSGLATVVVTDIEQYSGLTQWNGHVAAEALSIHNAILRKAAATHAGHVIEQEGDSWSVAFHAPMEAVAFCIQVQQALQKSSWPPELKMYYEELVTRVTGGSGDGSSGGPRSSVHGSMGRMSILEPTFEKRSSIFTDSLDMVKGIGSKLWAGRGQTSSSTPGDVAARNASAGSMASGVGTARASIVGSQPKGTRDLFRGLRVRIGIATGTVIPEGAITQSSLFKLAKVVSNMANGGQVLLEAMTFDTIRDRLTELGAVDHSGYNDALAGMAASSVRDRRRAWCGWNLLARLLKGTKGQDTDAVVLDMGLYWLPGTMISVQGQASNLETIEEPFSSALINTGATWLSSSAGRLRLDDMGVPLSRAAVTSVHCIKRHHAYPSLGLYSIYAQPLYARAKTWGTRMNMQSTAQQVAKGYFEAPGTAEVNSGGADKPLGIERPLLPSVTVIFAAVVDGDALTRHKQGIARAVHHATGSVMQALLMLINDGYMCRQQEGSLKYMLAFKQPSKAAEWCIMLQAVMQQLPWPVEVLTALAQARPTNSLMQKITPTRSTTHDSQMPGSSDGRVSRKRPGLKIGFAEGQPNSIYPDHLGHADYFGSSVNLAARMMDIAVAEEIVLSSDLAQRIFDTWRFEAELGCPNLTDGKVTTPELLPVERPNANEARMAAALPEATLGAAPETVGIQSVACSFHVGCDAQVSVARIKHPEQHTAPDASKLLSSRCANKVAHVSAHHIGTYAFKGCGAVDMVCLTSSIQLGAPAEQRKVAKEAKGTLITPNRGPVVGLQECPVALPDVLAAFERAWRQAQQHNIH